MSDKILGFLWGAVITVFAAVVGAIAFGCLMYAVIYTFEHAFGWSSLEGPSPLDRARIFAMTFGTVGGAWWVFEVRSDATAYTAGHIVMFLLLLAAGLLVLIYADGFVQIFQGPFQRFVSPIISRWY
jgi:hypothetical protein